MGRKCIDEAQLGCTRSRSCWEEEHRLQDWDRSRPSHSPDVPRPCRMLFPW